MLSAWNPKRLHALEAMEQQFRFAKERNLEALQRNTIERYIYNLARQLAQAPKEYHKILRRKLRWGLSQGRSCGVFAFGWETLWAYELVYPLDPIWWLVFKVKARIGR